jgi:hypothetical protein
MIALINPIDSVTRFAKFSITSASELSSLPTTKRKGAQGTTVGSVAPICAGSLAYVTDSDYNTYVLNGETDQWVKVNKSGGGGGGGEEELTPQQMQDILNRIGEYDADNEPSTP